MLFQQVMTDPYYRKEEERVIYRKDGDDAPESWWIEDCKNQESQSQRDVDKYISECSCLALL